MTPIVANLLEMNSPQQQRTGQALGSPVRLNTFQRIMLLWKTLGPYNASQVMTIEGPPDMARWREAVRAVIGDLGLGEPLIQASDRQVQFRAVEDIPLETTTQPLAEFLSSGLNHVFANGSFPIRFFVARHESGQAHHLGAIYDHWIADSRAMRDLMQRIYQHYHNAVTLNPLPPLPALTLESPPFNHLYRRDVGYLPRLKGILISFRNLIQHRYAHRLGLRDPLNFTSKMLYRPLPAGAIDRLYHYAKSRHASVNDCFLAVLGQVMGQFTAADRYKKPRRFHRHRRLLTLGTIVDIRANAQMSLDNIFGLYLSTYTVVLERPEEKSHDQLLAEIAPKTQMIKAQHKAVKGFLGLNLAEFWWKTFRRPKTRAKLFYKAVPCSAGISNVNMTGSWVDSSPSSPPTEAATSNPSDKTPRVLDYLRISPTGPLSPMVFTLTTIGSRLSLCVTYRTTAFTDQQANALVDEFIQRLTNMGQTTGAAT